MRACLCRSTPAFRRCSCGVKLSPPSVGMRKAAGLMINTTMALSENCWTGREGELERNSQRLGAKGEGGRKGREQPETDLHPTVFAMTLAERECVLGSPRVLHALSWFDVRHSTRRLPASEGAGWRGPWRENVRHSTWGCRQAACFARQNCNALHPFSTRGLAACNLRLVFRPARKSSPAPSGLNREVQHEAELRLTCPGSSLQAERRRGSTILLPHSPAWAEGRLRPGLGIKGQSQLFTGRRCRLSKLGNLGSRSGLGRPGSPSRKGNQGHPQI